jgi:hypothetical protein
VREGEWEDLWRAAVFLTLIRPSRALVDGRRGASGEVLWCLTAFRLKGFLQNVKKGSETSQSKIVLKDLRTESKKEVGVCCVATPTKT